jgi:superfamily II DNA or RNA helicase
MKLLKRTEIERPNITYNLHVRKNNNYVANGIVVSNCHGSKAAKLYQLLTHYGNNIVHRFGLTGTLPDVPIDKLNVHNAIGRIVCEYLAKDLIEKGWLATLKINIVQLDDVKNLEKHGVNNTSLFQYEEEKYYYDTNKSRMQWIADFVIKNVETKELGNTLILVNTIKYGKELGALIPNSYVLNGSDKVDARQKIYDMFEDRNDMVVICTKQIAGVGLSIDRIFSLVFVDSGKAFIGTIQQIGRGLRKGKDKDFVEVYDICGNLPSAINWMKKRISHYKGANYPHSVSKVEYIGGAD